MSRTFYIACPETKKRLWIGQGSTVMDRLFMTDDDYLNLLNYLNQHIGKSLLVLDSEDVLFDQLDYQDYEISDS